MTMNGVDRVVKEAEQEIRSLFPKRLMRVQTKGPYWTTLRGQATCLLCGDDLSYGEKVLVSPSEEGVCCAKKGCGTDMLSRQT